jgi:septal ring-binding cell division protein DamX
LIFRLRAAGYFGPHLFTDSAIKKLSSAAEGLVRRVNILADKSLLAAFADNVHQVTPRHVKAAIQDSEFGSNPINYKQYFLFATLLVGFLVTSLAYVWWQNQQKAENRSVKTLLAKSATVAVKTEVTNIVKPAVNSVDVKQQLVDKRLAVTKNWLFSGQPNTITLQILSSTNDEQLRSDLDKLSQQLEIDNIYLYRKKQDGQTLTVFLYGAFAQRSEALAALRDMPTQIKNNRPQLRTLAGINKEIEQTQ